MKQYWGRTVFPTMLALLTIGSAIHAQTPVANSSIGPMFAGVNGNGVSVGFSWWAVKGATGYELLRTADPQQKPVTVAAVSNTTLGVRDMHPASGPTYYQLVAIGAGGSRTAGAWFLYFAPTIKSASADGADVLVAWSGVKSAPGGYEVWRAPSPQQPPTRVAAVSSTILNVRDKQAGAGPFYYQVVAVGAGGSRAASPWFPFNTGFFGESATRSSSADEHVMAQLVAALKSAGINVNPSDLQKLTDGMTEGGAAALAIAQYLIDKIGNIHGPTSSDAGGGQSSSTGDPCPNCPPTGGDPTNSSTGSAQPLRLPQIDQVILGMPTDASASRFTNELKALLGRR